MPESSIEDLWEYAKLKPERRRAYHDAKAEKDCQHAAEHAAQMKASQQAWAVVFCKMAVQSLLAFKRFPR
eukprot:8027437-Karenia_brevis.AAC.1